MRLLRLLILGVAVIGLNPAADPTTSAQAPPPPPAQKGLAVHEWGVVSAYSDVELANADMRAEWEGLPKFVYGQVDGRKIPERIMAVRA